MKIGPDSRASAVFALAVLGCALSSCLDKEVRDELSNRINCEDVCEWATACGHDERSESVCEEDCEQLADANEDREREVERCAECIDDDDLTCTQNDEICSDDCGFAFRTPTT